MPDEFDPTVEMGLFPDRYFVSTCQGFLTRNDDLRQLCARFIENGAHFYDVVERYDKLTAYVLNREEATSGSVFKWCIPFLKAYGATDHLLYECSKDNLQLSNNAARTIRYISNILPTHMSTALYEHTLMRAKEMLDAPLCDMVGSQLSLDQTMMGRVESRKIREMAKEISSLRVSKDFYELNVPTSMEYSDIQIMRTMDEVIQDKLPETCAMSLMENSAVLTSHKKAYRLLDVRRNMNIDLDYTMYVGSSSTDFQPMDLVRDGGGLSVSFNGSEFAVRGCNIAAVSNDTTVVAVLASVFADGGVTAVMELAENWSRNYLKSRDFPDNNLVDTMLKDNPRKLPEVYVIDSNNVDEIADRSDKFRKKFITM